MTLHIPASCQFPEPSLRLNRICPYFTRFPLHFPLEQLSNSCSGQWVLDPFCGTGTTLFAARFMGLNAVGIDSNPVAVAIARAKLRYVAPEMVIDKADHILNQRESVALPEGIFWEQCYTRDTLEALCRFRTYFMTHRNTPVNTTLRALLMGLLHGPNTDDIPRFFSNHLAADFAPSPQNAIRLWREQHLKPPACSVMRMIRQRAVHLLRAQPLSITGIIKEGDSRKIEMMNNKNSFDWIITSPPYYGLDSYSTDQWLRNWFLGGPARPIKKGNAHIAHQNPKAYIRDLASVWKRVTPCCTPGARLIVRIGNVTGIKAPEAIDLFHTSLKESSSRWKIENIVPVHRDMAATQKPDSLFKPPAPWPENELEVLARLG